MSSWSSGSFSATGEDGNNGGAGHIARLDTGSNAVGLTTSVGPDRFYSGGTVFNRSPNQYVRVTINFIPGFLPVNPDDRFHVVLPLGAASFSFESDVVESLTVQVIDAPPPGAIQDAAAATVSGAVNGVVDVGINLVSN